MKRKPAQILTWIIRLSNVLKREVETHLLLSLEQWVIQSLIPRGRQLSLQAQTQPQPVCTAHTRIMVFTFSGYFKYFVTWKLVLSELRSLFIKNCSWMPFTTMAEWSHLLDRSMACKAQNIYCFRRKKKRLQACAPSALGTHSPNASCQNLNLRKTAPISSLVQQPIMSKLLDRSE